MKIDELKYGELLEYTKELRMENKKLREVIRKIKKTSNIMHIPKTRLP